MRSPRRATPSGVAAMSVSSGGCTRPPLVLGAAQQAMVLLFRKGASHMMRRWLPWEFAMNLR